MSESNLSPGEGWQDLGGSKQGAQCFQPKETHVLRYIDLELDSYVKDLATWAKVYLADSNGHPVGTPRSVTLHPWTAPNADRTPYRARITMMPTRLIAGHLYVMVIYCPKAPFPWSNRWQYQQDLFLYRGGWRLHSGDYGETWSEDWADDHVFAEFGNPPLFKVPYSPPPLYWALVYIAKNTYHTSTCFRFGTSSPVTMTLHVTENKPKAMETFKIVRGTKHRCLDYYSFNEWRYYLQKETGDSLYHTFHVGGLKEGQRYWMVNTAESDANPSLSISPIIVSTHPGGPPFTTIRRPDAPGSLCQIPYETGQPCPNHYLNINEATPDEDETQIYSGPPWRALWKQDLYHIPPYDMDPRPINEVHLTARLKYSGSPIFYTYYRISIKTHDTLYHFTRRGDLPAYWENRHWHLYTNPYTEETWTPAEIDDLQIGVGLWHNTGVGWSNQTHCTQLYATIKHKCKAFE